MIANQIKMILKKRQTPAWKAVQPPSLQILVGWLVDQLVYLGVGVFFLQRTG